MGEDLSVSAGLVHGLALRFNLVVHPEAAGGGTRPPSQQLSWRESWCCLGRKRVLRVGQG